MPLQCSKCKTRQWNKDRDIDVGGWVYLAQAIEPHAKSLVKIGWSTQPHVRMTALRDPEGQKVRMIAAMPCDTRAAEMKMHLLFSAYRIVGEWFAFTPELIDRAKQVDLFELTKPADTSVTYFGDRKSVEQFMQPGDKIRETVIDTSYAQD